MRYQALGVLLLLSGLSGCGSSVVISQEKLADSNTVRLTFSSTGTASLAEIQVNDNAPECGVTGRLPNRITPSTPLSFDVGYACPDVVKVRARIDGKWVEQRFAPTPAPSETND